MIPLLAASLVGGMAGAMLLLKTPAQTFMRVLPWLTLGATLLFAFGKKLAGGRKSVIEHEASTAALVGATLFQLCVAVYGGYFGGGMGIVMLAMLAVLDDGHPRHERAEERVGICDQRSRCSHVHCRPAPSIGSMASS